MKVSRSLTTLLTATIVLTACASNASTIATSPTTDSGSVHVADEALDEHTGVDGPIIRHTAEPSDDRSDAQIRGRIEISQGCIYVTDLDERYPVVWPRGTSWDDQAQAVVLTSGELLTTGDSVSGSGGYMTADRIERVVGPAAAELAEACIDNTNGEIAVVNNSESGIRPSQ